MNHEYWTYIVASLSGTLYIGITNNIERRAWEHKSGQFEGFAREYHGERLVYYEAFGNVLDAIAREKQLKGWRRSKKIALIESQNPRWEDLAEKWGWQRVDQGAMSSGGNFLWADGPANGHGVLRLRSAGASLRSG
jgi:putative endonuclease